MIRLLLPVPGNELKQQREKLHTSLLVLDNIHSQAVEM